MPHTPQDPRDEPVHRGFGEIIGQHLAIRSMSPAIRTSWTWDCPLQGQASGLRTIRQQSQSNVFAHVVIDARDAMEPAAPRYNCEPNQKPERSEFPLGMVE